MWKYDAYARTQTQVPSTAFRLISTQSLLIQSISAAREFSAHKRKKMAFFFLEEGARAKAPKTRKNGPLGFLFKKTLRFVKPDVSMKN